MYIRIRYKHEKSDLITISLMSTFPLSFLHFSLLIHTKLLGLVVQSSALPLFLKTMRETDVRENDIKKVWKYFFVH